LTLREDERIELMELPRTSLARLVLSRSSMSAFSRSKVGLAGGFPDHIG
jgi:hypothetical protein